MSSCVQRTSRQVAHSEAVLDPVAGLSVAPTLQAGVFLLRRLQHVVAAQTLKRENAEEYFMSNESWGGRGGLLQISHILPERRRSRHKNITAPVRTERDERQLVETVSSL